MSKSLRTKQDLGDVRSVAVTQYAMANVLSAARQAAGGAGPL